MGSINIFQLLIFLTVIISPFFVIYKFRNNEKNRLSREDFVPRIIITIICSIFVFGFPIGIFLFLGLYIYGLILIVKRLNDLNKNPSLLLLCLLPVINTIFIIYLSFANNSEQIKDDKK